MSKTVSVANFAANVDAVLAEIAEKQEEVVVMRDGRPVARVVPIASQIANQRRRTLERLRGSVTVFGDIVGPLDEEWDANK